MYRKVSIRIEAADCVQFPGFFSRLVFKTGLCAVPHPSDHHKITYCTQICTPRPVHPTHFLCRVHNRSLYSRGAYVLHSLPKRILLFKTGLYSRAAFIQNVTVYAITRMTDNVIIAELIS